MASSSLPINSVDCCTARLSLLDLGYMTSTLEGAKLEANLGRAKVASEWSSWFSSWGLHLTRPWDHMASASAKGNLITEWLLNSEKQSNWRTKRNTDSQTYLLVPWLSTFYIFVHQDVFSHTLVDCFRSCSCDVINLHVVSDEPRPLNLLMPHLHDIRVLHRWLEGVSRSSFGRREVSFHQRTLTILLSIGVARWRWRLWKEVSFRLVKYHFYYLFKLY